MTQQQDSRSHRRRLQPPLRPTLGSTLSERHNALSLVRLVLACAVVLGHTALIGGFGDRATSGLSSVAVTGFFVVSGYLIAGSRMRLGLGRFLWHRTLRIMPGLWVCLVVVALVLSPVAAAATGEVWQPVSAVRYIHSGMLLDPSHYGIEGTLADVPLPGIWNGSLWTLQFEFMAYVAAGLLLTSRGVRRHAKPVLCLLTLGFATGIALAEVTLHVDTYLGWNSLRLGASFAAGMTLWAFRDEIPRTRALTLCAGAVSAVLYFAPPTLGYALAPIPLGYLLLSLGGSRRVRLGPSRDLSYGLYIYAFPVQQLLAVLGGHRLGYIGFFLAALLLTTPLAWLSWTLVEEPALRLKDAHGSRRGEGSAPRRPGLHDAVARERAGFRGRGQRTLGSQVPLGASPVSDPTVMMRR